MKINPYKIDLPAVVSFSGGRTSGYLLAHILEAHGGQPEGLKVCFENTGLEHEKTLEFIHQCEAWCDVTWLEYDLDEDNKHATKVVDYESASRKGEPFTKMIRYFGYLPNPVARMCTANLKIRTANRWLRVQEGFEEGWTSAVGLRADEPHRARRIKADSTLESPVVPLYDAGVTQPMVEAWWKEQPFNLDLPLGGNIAGNCVGCFLKSKHKLGVLMGAMPEYFDWWIEAEAMPEIAETKSGGKFRVDRPPYKELVESAKRQPMLFNPDATDDSLPCFCTD